MKKDDLVFAMIFATDPNGSFGSNTAKSGLPWNCKADMRYFSQKTFGRTVVAGTSTWPKVCNLQNRLVLKITKTPNIENGEIGCLDDLECLPKPMGGLPIFIIGGAKTLLSLCGDERIKYAYHTTINREYRADTFLDVSVVLDGFEKIREIELSSFNNEPSATAREYIRA